MQWLTENNDETWRNSEIMRSFVDNHMSQVAKEEPLSSEVEDVVTSEDDNEFNILKNSTETTLSFVTTLLNERDKESVDIIVETLGDLASESVKYGNEKATYMIERTMEEIRMLKLENINEF